jgi:hypothetical protein
VPTAYMRLGRGTLNGSRLTSKTAPSHRMLSAGQSSARRAYKNQASLAGHPGLPGTCATPSSITTQGCFSEHHMCIPGFTHDGSSNVPALMKVKPE